MNEWHLNDIDTVFRGLESSLEGVPVDEINARHQKYGANAIPEAKKRGALLRFLLQFHDILIYVLISAAMVTAMLGHLVDTAVILGVVFLNALIGFIQEGKAEGALAAIKKMLSARARVIRGGRQLTIAAEQLVPGDVVLLQSGDRVPADLRLFRIKGLQIQESALTGESMAVEKDTRSVAEKAVVADRSCMAYSGTIVTQGQGRGIVVAIGAATEIGRISSLVSGVESLTTPLLRQMAQFGRWLTMAILLVSVVAFAFGYLLRGYSAAEMFLASVSLAVAAIPEGLPAIMTITLAIGVQKMARRNAIIRRLPAVETLGAVSVICSDKTGTLTKNEMTLRSVAIGEGPFELTGTGYDPHGEVSKNGKVVAAENEKALQEIMKCAILCNDTDLEDGHDGWIVHGDPMEGALLVAGMKVGLDIQAVREACPRKDLIPFESAHRFMATLQHTHDQQASIIVKGAPESMLAICETQRQADGVTIALDESFWQDKIEELAGRGQRIIAVAEKDIDCDQAGLCFDDVKAGFTLLGLFGMIDPPREEAIAAVNACKNAGIRVKMITGDHAATARSIAGKLQLENTREVITGEMIASMAQCELEACVKSVDVYARVSPEHKLRLVETLQHSAEIVAMTGDGVNDAPALKRADVGIAMGRNGTEAAREAAEIVLVDDNFASIAHAVEEGRTVFDNLKKAIIFILPTNGGEALIILGAIIFGADQLPLTPVQILWVNMVTAVTLALSLAFEPAEANVMHRSPRDTGEPIISRYLLWRILFVSVILMSGTFGLFFWEQMHGATIEYARTVAVNTLVMFEIFYLFNARYIHGSSLSLRSLGGNRYVLLAIAVLLILQIGFTYLEALQILFGTTSIGAGVWLRIIAVGSTVFFLVEFEKFLIGRMGKT